MSSPTYEELVAELFPRLTGGIRWGLERTRRMLSGVGDPHRAFRVLHVGGTNGKGSVAAHMESVLRQDGRRVGLYTSPHLCTFRERVRIAGAAIDEAALLSAAHRLWPAVRREEPSFFEATTAIAFLALAEAGVDIAVVEVGLGGRLDATNVVSPDVVALTNVSLDHVQLLGPTLRDIAREKAGIIKPGAPVVTAETGADALAEFRAAAGAAGVALEVLGDSAVTDVDVSIGGTSFTMQGAGARLWTRLVGSHQARNAALAVRALALLPDAPSLAAVQAGLAAVRWPGRLQVERLAGTTWAFDVAHNVAGVESLVAAARAVALPRPITAVVGVLGDKDWHGMLSPLCDLADRVVLTEPPTAPAERRWNPDDVLRQVTCGNGTVTTDLLQALRDAAADARRTGGSVIVTGSFHTVGDALAVLGLCPDGRDAHMPAPAAPGDAPSRPRARGT